MALLPWYGTQTIHLRVGPFFCGGQHSEILNTRSSLRVFSYVLYQKEVTAGLTYVKSGNAADRGSSVNIVELDSSVGFPKTGPMEDHWHYSFALRCLAMQESHAKSLDQKKRNIEAKIKLVLANMS